MSFIRRHAFRIALAATVAMFAVLTAIDPKSGGSDHDTVALERAGNVPDAREIVADWRSRGLLERGRLSVRLDFLFILAYASSLWLAGRGAAARVDGTLAGIAKVAAFLGPVAGFLDLAENLALLRVLEGEITAGAVRIARICADLKFLLIGLALATLATVGGVLLKRRFHRSKESAPR